METEHFCARCAKYMRNCCQTPDVYVTPGDVARIAFAAGVRDFFEWKVSDDPVYQDQDDDPFWRENVLGVNGSRRVLRHTADGDCCFLGPNGCQLALDTRPLVCRLYPFDYTEKGISKTLASGCPTELLASGEDLLAAIGMNHEDAQRWHRQLYQEIRLERMIPCTLV